MDHCFKRLKGQIAGAEQTGSNISKWALARGGALRDGHNYGVNVHTFDIWTKLKLHRQLFALAESLTRFLFDGFFAFYFTLVVSLATFGQSKLTLQFAVL